MENCYNCGVELTDETQTKEHIPAKNLFAGFSEEYKKNLLTVPACRSCNEEYGKTDQRVRDAIGIMNDKDAKKAETTRKSVKSILRQSGGVERLHFNAAGKVIGVNFDNEEMKTHHIKNFKGLFYAKYGYPLPENYVVRVIHEGDSKNSRFMEIAGEMTAYVTKEGNWESIGHPDIFQHNMKTLEIGEGGKVVNGTDLEKAIGVVAVMKYHNQLSPVVLAFKGDYVKTVPKPTEVN
jgi:hypothetical protein